MSMRSTHHLRTALLACLPLLHLTAVEASAQQSQPALVVQNGHLAEIADAAFSPDGRFVVTGSRDGSAILWDVATGREIRRVQGHDRGVVSVAFSPDGRTIATGDWAPSVVVRDAATGREVARVEGHAVAFTPDGRSALTIDRTRDTNTVRIWDIASGRELRRLRGHGNEILSVELSRDGRLALTTSRDATARVWDVATARELLSRPVAGGVNAAALSAYALQLLTLSDAGVVQVTAIAGGGQGTEVALGFRPWQGSSVFSPDRRFVAATQPSADSTVVHVMDLQARREVARFRAAGDVTTLEFSPDGAMLLVADVRPQVLLYDTRTWRVAQMLQGYVPQSLAASLAPDTLLGVSGSRDGSVRIWDLESGRATQWLRGHRGAVDGVAFSADAARVLSGGDDAIARLWDAASGVELQRFDANGNRLQHVAFAPGDTLALAQASRGIVIGWDMRTGKLAGWQQGGFPTPWIGAWSADRTLALSHGDAVRLWRVDPAAATNVGRVRLDTQSWGVLGRLGLAAGGFTLEPGGEVARMISFANGNWAVVAPDGRFDTGDLESLEGVHWVMPDDPMRPLPLELFMRDYFEPGLLGRLLREEPLPDIPPVSERNRVQPRVSITDVTTGAGGTATVTVELSNVERRVSRGADPALARSGAADLRVFRDRQLVGHVDGPLDVAPGATRQFTFRDVKLRRGGPDSLTFTAYAFNTDRVKSATAQRTIARPAPTAPARRRAYIIAIGVDAYESPAWNLDFAASDARVFASELPPWLGGAGGYDEVVAVPLIAARDVPGSTPPATSSTPLTTSSTPQAIPSTNATKAAIRTVIDLLAGRPVSGEARALVPNASRIRAATPDDLVLITFSGHGYNGDDGTFYMFPSDIGAGVTREVTPQLLQRAVSSFDLADWLRDVDAGELALVVDACHSAAAVEGENFKPGPMGSRGLGQLAYDKGMRVLAASQAENVALESNLLRHGLLTYALVRDGLEAGQADHAPADGTILLDEWLRYAVQRVPQLYAEVIAGEVQTFGRGIKVTSEGAADPLFQRPALFDFRRGAQPVVLDNDPAR